MGKGKAEGCAAISKILLIMFNILFCLFGAGLIALGVYVYITLSEYLNLFGDSRINGPAIALLVFGILTLFIAALGCIGACKESPCLLFTFSVIIGVIVIAEIGIGIAGFVFRNDIDNFIHSKATPDVIELWNTESGKDVWNKLQTNLKCCGINGRSDWENATITVPASCPPPPPPNVQEGCLAALEKLAKENIYYIGAVGVAVGVIQLLGVAFACCVGCQARKGAYA